MTSRHPVALALAWLLTACTDAQPCSSCPALTGTYTMGWTHTSTGCGQVGPTPTQITLGQVGSTMTALVGATTLTGTLYDTNDFSLAGASNTLHSTMRGYAVLGAFVDAGAGLTPVASVTISGSLNTQDPLSDAGCAAQDSFVGTLTR